MANNGNMGGNPIKVMVHAEKPGTVPMFWQEWEEDKGSPMKKGDIDLARDSGSHVINFHLKDHSGLKLSFPEMPADAMYVALEGCPRSAGNGDGQIRFDNVDPHNNVLKVEDANSGDPCALHYQLNFVDESGTTYHFDPIIKNGGGVSV